MKKTNVLASLLLALVVSHTVAQEVSAASRVKEVIFAKKVEDLEDPYFKVTTMRVRALTDEEALEFTNDLELTAKNQTVPTFPNLPTRPITPSIPVPTNPAAPGSSLAPATGGGGGVLEGIIMVVDKLIAIGQKIIPTIEKGKAVVTNNPMSAISVLPRVDAQYGVVHEMGSWSVPVTKHFQVNYSNGLGMDVISFVYSVTYQYGGKFKGEGAYLTGIRASARKINIVWGFDLDASSQLIQISNVGTEQNVVAGATIEMAYTVKNWTRQITNYKSYFITGKGKLIALD